jgi:hypothetical protein
MTAEKAHPLGFARQKIEVVVLEMPAECVSVCVSRKLDRPGVTIGFDLKEPALFPQLEHRFGEGASALDLDGLKRSSDARTRQCSSSAPSEERDST